jgi:hypothetical protein
MSDSATPQDSAAMSTASAGSGGYGKSTATDTKGFSFIDSRSLATVLRSLAMDARLDLMPAKFRFSMLEAAKRLG